MKSELTVTAMIAAAMGVGGADAYKLIGGGRYKTVAKHIPEHIPDWVQEERKRKAQEKRDRKRAKKESDND